MRLKKTGFAASACIVLLLLASVYLLSSDRIAFLSWYLLALVMGLCAYPLVSRMFSAFADKGWLFAKAISIGLCGFVLWALCVSKVVRFNTITTIAVTVLMLGAALAVAVLLKKKAGGKRAEETGADINLILAEEAIFLLVFLLWSYLAGFRPEAHGTEKFMDYGFMAAMMRSDTLPAPDIWYAPEKMNYYYGGQYYAVYLTKLTGAKVAVTYNLMRSFVAAMLGSMSFSIVYQMLVSVREKAKRIPHVLCAAGGLLGTAFVTFSGNVHYVLYGLLGKWMNLKFAKDYWFPDSTRYIGYDPETADKCIHEFPSYSFVLGDLHAHVVNTMFVLVLVGLMLSLFLKAKPLAGKRKSRLTRQNLYVFSTQPVSGTHESGTAWTEKDEGNKETENKEAENKETEPAENRAAADERPDAVESEMAEGERPDVSKAGDNSKDGKLSHQLLKSLCVPQLILAGIFIGIFHFTNYWDFIIYFTFASVCIFVLNLYRYRSDKKRGVLITLLQAAWMYLIGTLAALPFTLHFQSMVSGIALAKHHTMIHQYLVLWGLPLAVSVLFGVFALRKWKKDETGPGLSDGFALVTALCAIGLILIPEVVYVKDIYENGYARSNTMFKLTYQAFILFGLFVAYAFVRMLAAAKHLIIRFIAGALLLLQLLTVLYSYTAARAWYGPIFNPKEYRGLDATRYLSNVFAEDYGAITWLNENIKGNAVILEANGDSYSDYARVTAMTGLSTPLGWYVHEWLWRGDVAALNARSADIETMYTATDADTVRALLDKYKVEYIYVGKYEYEKFGADKVDTTLLQSLGEVVYGDAETVGGTFIVRVEG